ncbi:MAG TPA: serine/threonine-protein kinase, partial [Planctomycetaceae bacterium]|nr:serine/threonine-protein kinase [Planctomycetaceae bacterium]
NLVLEDRTVKILDMGLARKLDADDSITQDGSGLGTPDYMSPEQFVDAHRADVRSDLYSLGCTWYHMLTGRPPFGGSTAVQKGFSHINTPPPSVRSLAPSAPDDLAAVIAKLLAKKPQDRYQTPSELLAELRDWSGAEPDADATRTWSAGAATAGLAGDTKSDSAKSPPVVTPTPASEPDSATLVTAPATSIPAFLLYLIPVMGALVLGGAYFGIQALVDRQAGTEPLVLRVSEEEYDAGRRRPPAAGAAPDSRQTRPPANSDRVRPSDRLASQPDGAAEESERPVAAPQPQPQPPPPPAAPAVTDSAADPGSPRPPIPARPAQTWRFETAGEWQAAWNDILDGDRIELAAGRLIDFDGEALVFDAVRLTLAAGGSGSRPVIRWTLPGDRRFSDGLIQVAQGGLVIEGIDLYVDLKNQNAAESALPVFALQQSDLHFINSSVTVLNAGRLPVTVVALNGERPWDAQARGAAPHPVVVDIRDALIRAADAVIAVDSRQARVSVENSVVCGRGGLVHVFHTRPLEFAHHAIRLEISSSVLDLTGPLVTVDCRPFELRPVPLEVDVASSLLMGSSASLRPAQVAWDSPVETETVSTAIRWGGRENRFFQWGDGLTVRTVPGPVVTLVQSPDDWKRLELGDEVGWRSVPRLRLQRTPEDQRLPADYDFARDVGIDLKQIAHPARRLPR